MMEQSRIQFLDACRGAAACYVALAHIMRRQFGVTEGWSSVPWLFGQEAVVAFFFLSGYIIQYSVARQPQMTVGQFLWRRFLRLYPLLMLALIFSYVTASLAARHFVEPRLAEALAGLVALQDFSAVKPGTYFNVYWGNAALWSLSYECWFYLIFAFLHWYVPFEWRTPVAGLLSAAGVVIVFVWPTGAAYWAAYFVIWWMGRSLALDGEVFSARREKWRTVSWLAGSLVMVGIGTAWQGVAQKTEMRFGTYPLLVLRHFLFAGVLAAMILWASERFSLMVRSLVRPFAAVSAWSYGLFVLHFPLAANAPWLQGRVPRLMEITMYFLTAVLISWWAEQKYYPWVRTKLERWAAGAGLAFARRGDVSMPRV